ncbi:hypothetical protein RHSIM_Rhsim08G0204900 [Rhododendron simsii]|uniref:KIB1-4 beta-propeller domain-containing protein n=1 Tax=Rhododendron simsii TaxID=118357 RepID=A0A834GN91_RHOSS|nr:hypothetical protein RHSIM_Rhsim08G0204900 [Rhododendron simsii]
MAMATTTFPVPHPQLSCPWLVINQAEKRQGYSTQTFVDIAQDHYDVVSIPEMLNKRICTCAHGWLVLFDYTSDDCFLLNPVSMEKIMLPELPPAPLNSFDTCILSAPPTDPECVVILVTTDSHALFLRLGESRWTEQYLRSEREVFRQAAVCGRKIYGLAPGGTLVTVKVVGSKLVVTELGAEELPNEAIPEAFKFFYDIVESCGEVFGVVKYYLGGTSKIREVEVYKLDFSRLAWTKVESLGNRAFFLSGTTCNFSCPTTTTTAESRVKQNCIYFIEGNDRDLYVFDMENYSISFSTPCPVQSNWSQPRWVMPAAAS